MRITLSTLLIAAILIGCKDQEEVVATTPAEAVGQTLMTKQDSLSYALGLSIGKNLIDQGFNEVDRGVFSEGMRAAEEGEPLMDPLAADAFIRGEMTRARAAMEQEMKQAGQDYLEANKSKEGVITTESGLQYKVVREGDGPSPVASDKVTVNYEGRLIDDSIFDSSYQKGNPATFALTGVIKGWTEGLQTMKVGGETEFYIPYDLGYGSRPGPGGRIPAYSTLVFKVELLEVVGK